MPHPWPGLKTNTGFLFPYLEPDHEDEMRQLIHKIIIHILGGSILKSLTSPMLHF